MNAQIYTNCIHYCINIHETVNTYYDKFSYSLVTFITTYENILHKVVDCVTNISKYEKELLIAFIIVLSTSIFVFNIIITIELLYKILNKLWKFIVKFNPYFIINFNLNNSYNESIDSILKNTNNSIDAHLESINTNINDESSVVNYNKNTNYLNSDSDTENEDINNDDNKDIYVRLTNIHSLNPSKSKRYITQRRTINTRSKKQKI